MVDPKILKKLAKACREAGIKHYKDADMEFTLTDEAPQTSAPRGHKAAPQPAASGVAPEFETDSLSPEELLFWSVNNNIDESSDKEGDGR